jgi:hypothetical protein
MFHRLPASSDSQKATGAGRFNQNPRWEQPNVFVQHITGLGHRQRTTAYPRLLLLYMRENPLPHAYPTLTTNRFSPGKHPHVGVTWKRAGCTNLERSRVFLIARKGTFQLKGMAMTAGYQMRQQTSHLSPWSRLLLAVVCVWPLFSSTVYAQKGMGDQDGVARQGLRPSLTRLTGKILSVETHPCEKTTGPALAGTHLIVEGTDGKRYNLHLGPANAVASIVTPLQPGVPIEVTAFRTSKMPEDQYVVSTLLLENSKMVQLRDSDLRPFWSRRSDLPGGRNQGFAGRGPGRGFGWQSRRQSARHCGPRNGPR